MRNCKERRRNDYNRWIFLLAVLAINATAQDAPFTSIDEIQRERKRLDATVFANEVEAQRYEQTFVRLWDDLRSGDPYSVLTSVRLESVSFAEPKAGPPQDWGLAVTEASLQPGGTRTAKSYSIDELHAKLKHWKATGWKIDQTEWHHAEFRPANPDGAPASSIVSFEIDASLTSPEQRVVIRGNLDVTWSGKEDAGGRPLIAAVKAHDVTLLTQLGIPLFKKVIVADPKKLAPGRFPRVTPLIAEDLNGDGKSEVILAGCNVVLRNKGNLEFGKEDFLQYPIIRPAEAGILADFTGDSVLDYIGGDTDSGKLLLFKGKSDGSFPHRPNTCFEQRLDYLHTLTAGDVDGDGDLDLFAGQWKPPYIDGIMPTPYWDANDGHPDFLLINDGTGNFGDRTEQSGLAQKRNRRTFSASWLDLNDDHHLDLIVVADFAGMDAYLNDGKGRFHEATGKLLGERAGFGMSHTIADFNRDGKTDIYMVGMSSTTARRLDRLGLGRPGFETHDKMRAPMAFGNRLLLRSRDKPFFAQPRFATDCARTGWSWGCTAADFDVDGDTDLFVSNGHLSGSSAKDYCSRFWCHDLYTGNSSPNKLIDTFFKGELQTKLGKEFSWNGFEHNVLYLNQPDRGFLNTAFLNGVAGEFDSRGVVADDLNFDGRPDLLVIEYNTSTMSQVLHIYANQLPTETLKKRAWIGIRLYGGPDCASPLGAFVKVRAGGNSFTKQIVTGDSFTSQHAAAALFGIGTATKLDSVEVRWHNGLVTKAENSKPNHYIGMRGVKL
jgi:hypothetical protein